VLIFIRNPLLGLKLTMLLLQISMASPVRGLRPFLGVLFLTFNVPKWTSLIDSPFIRVYFMMEKTVSTISSALRWEKPNFALMAFARSLRVIFDRFIVWLVLVLI
jgi:hypothetical protein